MNFKDNKVLEIYDYNNLLGNPLQTIEICGRLSYKSTSDISNESARKFIYDRIKGNHLAVLEHGYVFFTIDCQSFNLIIGQLYENKHLFNYNVIPYIYYKKIPETYTQDRYFVLFNYRVAYNIIDITYKNNITNLLHFATTIRNSYTHKIFVNHLVYAGSIIRFCDLSRMSGVTMSLIYSYYSDIYDILPFTVICNTNRGVTHELVRHRKASFLQESTRFCNYSKDRFNKSINYIYPFNYIQGKINKLVYKFTLYIIEKVYMFLIKRGVTAQIARGILPNDLSSTIAITANGEVWKDILNQRLANAAHPHMKELMNQLISKF